MGGMGGMGGRSQDALRGGDAGAFDAHGVAQGAGDGFERLFQDVVRVLPGPQTDVERDGGAGDKGTPELLGQLRVEGGTAERRRFRRQVDLVSQIRPARKIEGHVDQRLVERYCDGREAADAGLVAQRVAQHLTEQDPDVLDGVVRVDRQVALGGDRKVETAVAAQLREHVVVEGNSGVDRCVAAPIHLQGDLDRGFLGLTLPLREPRHERVSVSALRKRSSSSGVPTVIRRHPCSRGQLSQLRTSTERCTSSSHTCPPDLFSGRNRMKFDSDGHVSTGKAARAAASRSRSATSALTRASISSVNCRARRPASCFNVSRWYGRTRSSSSATTARGPIRYPRRVPAIDQVLEYVRVTTIGTSSATSASADQDANCA